MQKSDALSSETIGQIERVALLLADAAASKILPHFRQTIVVDNKLGDEGYDPVTIADRDAEIAMREILDVHRPNDGILGEEFGEKTGTSGYTWILDPVDGTRAFITGVPQWGTLIGLHDGVKPVFGLMDQPFLGERYIGSELGSQLVLSDGTRTRLQVRVCKDLQSAVMLTTTTDMFNAAELDAFSRLRRSVLLSRFGGDCYAYCMLASGFVDLVVEAGLQIYDIQPLVPIIEAAGGVVSNWQGEILEQGGQVIAAADPAVHENAIAMLRDCKTSN